ncbi:MAG TPA: sulfotransferase, partial [Candidatus Deferrimicrobium sp.]|nr:sulfotransferase [Candidatus Deferrimicrobium sp.]
MLSGSEIMNEARHSANLSDWGDDDWLEPLDRLIEYFNDKYGPDGNPMMKTFFKNTIRTLLVNRLHIQHNFTTYPEILQVPIHRPLFIVGLARTGSTLLHRLLAQDPNCRVLKYWEMLHPFFSPQLGLNHEELGIKLAQLKIKEIYSQLPGLHHIHEINALEPEECNILMRHTFCSMHLASEWRLPGYARWLMNHDMEKNYRFYRKMLQLLLWYKPGEFTALKCPSHLLNLRIAANVFPDANFVWLHRNPHKAMPSYLDLLSVFWGDETKNKRFIDYIFDYSVQSVKMGMTMAKEIPGERFLHIGYKELLGDPAGIVLKIYKHFNYEINPSIMSNTRSWLEKNPQHKHGIHKYDPGKFGLSNARIDEEFGPYIDAYQTILT